MHTLQQEKTVLFGVFRDHFWDLAKAREDLSLFGNDPIWDARDSMDAQIANHPMYNEDNEEAVIAILDLSGQEEWVTARDKTERAKSVAKSLRRVVDAFYDDAVACGEPLGFNKDVIWNLSHLAAQYLEGHAVRKRAAEEILPDGILRGLLEARRHPIDRVLSSMVVAQNEDLTWSEFDRVYFH